METLLPFHPAFVAAYGILLVGAYSPGPDIAMLMGLSLSQGRVAALIACVGIACGSATINILTFLGMGLILSQAVWAMSALRILCAVYLAYLAYGAFKKALDPPSISTQEMPRQSARALFIKGYLLQVCNPKAIAFWLTIAALGATASTPLWIIALFVLGALAISFICHGVWALALSAQAMRCVYTHTRRYIEGALGAFLPLRLSNLPPQGSDPWIS